MWASGNRWAEQGAGAQYRWRPMRPCGGGQGSSQPLLPTLTFLPCPSHPTPLDRCSPRLPRGSCSSIPCSMQGQLGAPSLGLGHGGCGIKSTSACTVVLPPPLAELRPPDRSAQGPLREGPPALSSLSLSQPPLSAELPSLSPPSDCELLRAAFCSRSASPRAVTQLAPAAPAPLAARPDGPT